VINKPTPLLTLKTSLFFCFSVLAFCFVNTKPVYADIVPKTYPAKRFATEIKIDGFPNDEAWKTAVVADHFIQLDPDEGAPVSQLTEVRLLYDNTAIYLTAIMYDSHPDSILHQLGNRDEGGELNSDAFRLGIDPYNKRENGYVFEVSASGVQTESFDDDLTFDAVWQSAVQLTDSGWIVEMKIPYSTLRFPARNEQHWGLQFARLIRRNREYDQWTLTPKNIQNRMLYWGTLEGIENVDPPLRLSLTPYFSIYSERASVIENGVNKYENSYTYSGGADIKYGIDERFTLDMTLLPDFSQVQSDNKVKNLSAFETIYDFKEGTSLFSKGGLFYSRRIGKTPSGFYTVADSLGENEVVSENPDKAKLYNAVKISGRTDHGTGIGILNAVTGNTYAVIKNTNGQERKFLTEPLTNYNLFIVDQQLKNNCNIALVNTNVMRNGKERDANVTSVEGRFENKKHQYRITGTYSESHVFEWQDQESFSQKENITGQRVRLYADKISGNSQYGLSTDGYIFETDYSHIGGYYSYNKFNPFWKHFKQGSITIYTNRNGKLSINNELISFNAGMNLFLLFNNNWSLFLESDFRPMKGRDFYEPRLDDRFFRNPASSFTGINFTTDYNKTLAFDFGVGSRKTPSQKFTNAYYYINPKIRLSDRLNIRLEHTIDNYNNDVGFAYIASEDSSIFGNRDIITIVNSISSRYLFKNDMSLSLTARHYWSKGVYKSFSFLQSDGELLPVSSFTHDYDFNSNYLTVDIVYNWQFAPGSSIIVTYKNLIFSDTQNDEKNYFSNLSNTFSEPQTNSVSLKVLYYLDYQYLVKRKA
jgi:hypothetical protein